MTLNDIPSLERRLLGLFGIVALAVIVTFLAFSWLRHRSDLQGQAALFERTTDAAALGLRVVASRAEQAVATLAATLPASGDCQAQVAATASTLPAPVISLAVQEAGGTIRCATEDGLARLVLTRVGATNPDGGAGVTWTIIPGDGTVPAVLVVGRGMRRENGGAGVVLAVLGAAGLQQVITPFYEDPKPRAWIADARGATIPALNGEAGEHAVARRPIIGGLDLVAVPPSLPILDVLRDFLLRLGLVVAVLAAGFLMLRHFWRQHVDTPMMRLEGILASQDETQLREFLDASDTPLRGVAVAASASRAKLRRRLAMRDLLLREMAHRLRNNLSVVASLLRLQARQVSDPTARQALEAAGDRVRTLALVQQDLQEAARGPGPVLGEFAWRIVERHIAGSEELADRIAVRWAGDDFRLAPEQVMPVGLIVNEWTALTLRGPLANCVEGSIHIRVRADEAGAMLLWADNGENRSADEPHALSRAILDGLVLQIGGELRGAEAGLRWRLFVPRTAA